MHDHMTIRCTDGGGGGGVFQVHGLVTNLGKSFFHRRNAGIIIRDYEELKTKRNTMATKKALEACWQCIASE